MMIIMKSGSNNVGDTTENAPNLLLNDSKNIKITL